MSVGRARRRKQKAWLRSRKGVRSVSVACPSCGKNESHFVPPGFGSPGMFICNSEEVK